MKKLLKILFSPRTTLGLLVIFAMAMAAATFIENSYDTITAKLLIYNAKWFEILMVLMILNFIGSIKRYNLISWKKISGFIFHTAFVIIIIGAGVTRYVGFEGRMAIREGASSNFILSDETFLSVRANDGVKDYAVDKSLAFGMITNNFFELELKTEGKGDVQIAYNNYLKKAKETFEEGQDGGFTMLALTISVDGHKDEMLIKDGELLYNHNFPIAFNNNSRADALKIMGTADNLTISYPANIVTAAMPAMTEGVIEKDSLGAFTRMMLYKPEQSGIALVLTKVYQNTAIKYVEGGPEDNLPGALILDVTHNGITKEATILGGPGYIDNFQDVPLDGISLKMAYGGKKIMLPFTLQLRDFQLERYAGSMSPSSYASEVTLIDPTKGIREDHRIYMNNVLDYGGYRFFQSSYDKDEKGTILSVNHDMWGTWITYIGYALMIIGFVWTLFNKNSRYWELMGKIRHLRTQRKGLTVILLALLFSTPLIAQHKQTHQHQENPYSVSEAHANRFAELVVQTYDGRFAPVHTLAIDVMHKISRKDKFNIPSRGKMSAVQVFLDMPLNPEFWKNQSIVYVREKAVTEVIGMTGKYVAFNDFFNEQGAYKLQTFAETAFRKPDAERNTFDKEIIKVNERLEVFMMAFQAHMLDIFPVQNSQNNKWVSWEDQRAQQPLTGPLKIINDDLQLEVLNYSGIMRAYFLEVIEATKTADYKRADKLLGYLKSIQRQSAAADIIPSTTKIEKEISYNKSNIFINLKNVYGLLSVLLLFLAFVDNLRAKRSKVLSWALNVSIALLAVGFLYHTYGMAMRWYLSGHAPWSNGYEALILVSWASLLAGFSFMRYSKITLAATSLLAFFTLMTASHSSYDPQLTNLVPVLKSYWLIIHVATLTISYGFLGLGFVLGLFNMCIYIFKNKKNGNRLSLITKELTHINEMNLTIGLFLATIGTFLGGVWANESWGRYWGWDSKETWALIITIVYTIILHFRLAPKLKGEFIFNLAAVFGFGSVLMTFIGVNYYFTKGLHSYASGETPVFPMWAWIIILSIIALMVIAGINQKKYKSLTDD
ncbi:cytochrome c biogenesis protein [Aestuariivivens sp. NBU2969]|uniref:cytochrome c biogenesis protein n=1 Tax=Aestuariivivens sp. NBU2969 TaxID=2873267 RepID=UPI001CBE350E|nr:cytochrome c biogenesis protein CcsA [Aestuariivivens sp. NBU2969]